MVIKQEVAFGIVRGLSEFWKCEELQDFTVSIGTFQFRCHRLLLAACSDFFRGLFRSEMKETELKNVTIKGIPNEIFELILETIYTGHGVLTNDNIIDIWKAAHQLQIHFLVSECENFVSETLSLNNYVEYLQTCKALNSDIALGKVWSFILKNCNSFFKTSYFLELPNDDVLSLIKSQDLIITSEDVIEAILKWSDFKDNQIQPHLSGVREEGKLMLNTTDKKEENIGGSGDELSKESKSSNDTYSNKISAALNNIDTHDRAENLDNHGDVTNKDKRCDNLSMLISHARTGIASQKCLEMLANHPLAKDNKEVKDIVIDALLYKLRVGKRNGHWPSKAVYRNNSELVHCLVVITEKTRNGVAFDVYSPAKKKWFKLKGLINFETIKLAAVDKSLYAICTSPRVAEFSFYLLQNGVWLKLNICLISKTKSLSVIVLDFCVYCFSVIEKKMWKLDTISQKLIELSILYEIESISHLVSYDQWILVFCASSVKDVNETVIQCYDTSQNTWTKLNNLKGPANGLISFKDDHFTYILQSNGDLWKVVKPQSNIIDFELVGKLWSFDRPLYGAVILLDDLYLFGLISINIKNDPHLRESLPGVCSKIIYQQITSVDNPVVTPIILNQNELM